MNVLKGEGKKKRVQKRRVLSIRGKGANIRKLQAYKKIARKNVRLMFNGKKKKPQPCSKRPEKSKKKKKKNKTKKKKIGSSKGTPPNRLVSLTERVRTKHLTKKESPGFPEEKHLGTKT